MLDSLPAWLADALRILGLGDIAALQERLAIGIGQLGQMVAARALPLGQDTFSLLTGIVLMLWVLGFSGALLWGAVMGFLSLLPAVGAALVWGPVARDVHGRVADDGDGQGLQALAAVMRALPIRSRPGDRCGQ